MRPTTEVLREIILRRRGLRAQLLRSGIILLILVSIYIGWRLLRPLPPTDLSLGTGPAEGAYFSFALQYQAAFDRESIDINIIPGPGSEETLDRLLRDEIDAGFIQGGIANERDVSNLRSLGSLFYEPIWVFYRAEHRVRDLRDLAGLRIAIGVEGSGTQAVALRLLMENNISAENAEFSSVDSSLAASWLAENEVDAAFFIISPEADLIDQILRNDDINLLDFERALAYEGRFQYLAQITIGQGLLSLTDNIPGRDYTLLATTATLVVQENTHPNLIRLLLREADRIHSPGTFLERVDQFPTASFVEIPLHEEARSYYNDGLSWFERNFPFILAALLDRIIVFAVPLLAIYTLVQTILPGANLASQYQIAQWYRVLDRVERRLEQMTAEQLQAEITRLSEVMRSLNRRVTVPFLYLSSVYTLKIHIRFVISLLEDQLTEINKQSDQQA